MGREVRMVPPDWKHPVDEANPVWYSGGTRYNPLLGGTFEEAAADWDEEKQKWDEGLVRDYSQKGSWKPKSNAALECESYDDWNGSRPKAEDYMPTFAEGTATHYMMYETCSEGSPISPAFATPEELARWLADTGASSFGDCTASYDEWLHMITGDGWAVSAVVTNGVIKSGVEAGL